MVVKRINLKTGDITYFAGYDSSSEDCCTWTPQRIGAVNIRRDDIVEKLLRFLLIHMKETKYIIKVE